MIFVEKPDGVEVLKEKKLGYVGRTYLPDNGFNAIRNFHNWTATQYEEEKGK